MASQNQDLKQVRPNGSWSSCVRRSRLGRFRRRAAQRGGARVFVRIPAERAQRGAPHGTRVLTRSRFTLLHPDEPHDRRRAGWRAQRPHGGLQSESQQAQTRNT